MSDRLVAPMPFEADADYVTSFDALARLEIEIRRRGPSPHLLLRRAMLSMGIGNYVGALQAAQDAVTACPREAEAHYQEGLAWLWMARVQTGHATCAPGAPAPTKRPLRILLGNAHDAFCAAMACAEDEDTEQAVAWLEGLLAQDDPVPW